MKYVPFYCHIAHEPKGRGVKTKRIWEAYMMKFTIRTTRVSKSLHLKRYTRSC
jgi:hypothetical protein